MAAGSKEVRRVLVADDEPQILSLLKEALFQEGVPITLCRDGAQALEALEKNTFTFVVLDVMMPRRTGVEVVQALRGRGDETPIVLMSSFLGEDVFEACKGFPRLAFLQKPFTLAELRSAIDRASSTIRC